MSEPVPEPALELLPSRQFVSWMAELDISVLFTTYQAGKLFLLGSRDRERLSVFQRSFKRCMGLCAGPRRLFISTIDQVWRLENFIEEGSALGDHDALYVPRMSWVTGDLDIHDMALDSTGQLLFVNTLFSCIATLSEEFSFAPLWKPPFISRVAAEDRCHLNGLAMRDGKPAYATAVADTDVADAWREHRNRGGVVIDISENMVVAHGLSMPHSPRWHGGRLWILNSGLGEFGYVEPESGRFVPVAFCPGFLRGLTFVDNFAIVCTSRPRHDRTFAGLALADRLAHFRTEARCGLHIIDLVRGDVVHWLRLDGAVEELYDVAAIKGIRRPAALGFQTDEIRRTLRVDNAYLGLR